MASKVYTFRLSPGRDDNIIALLDSIPKGEMSVLIRQALRAFIGSQPVAPTYVPVVNKPIRTKRPEGSEQKPEGIEVKLELPPIQHQPPEQEVDLDAKLDALINNFL